MRLLSFISVLVFPLLASHAIAFAGEFDAFEEACRTQKQDTFAVTTDSANEVWGKCTLPLKNISWGYFTPVHTVGGVATVSNEKLEKLKAACSVNGKPGKIEIGAAIPSYRIGDSGDITLAVVIWCKP